MGSLIQFSVIDLHVARKAGEGLVEVVHLRQDAYGCENHKDISRGVRKLVVAGKSKLQGDTESLDRHDGDGADGGADGQVNEGVLLSVDWCDLVNHEYGEGDDCDGVE